MLSEMWINDNSSLKNINNYTFVSSFRLTCIGGGVGFYVHNSLKFSIKNRSSDQLNFSNIDFILIHLIENNLLLCCLYCPPKCRLHDVILLIESLRSTSNHLPLIFGSDFNINLLDDNEISTSFLNSIHTIGLHPNYSFKNKLNFHNKLQHNDWTYLYFSHKTNK